MDEVTEQTDTSREQTTSVTDKSESRQNLLPIKGKYRGRLVWAAAIILVFLLYVLGISYNPPGFYLDESGYAYNAYLVAQTGAGEFGSRFPLFFQFYTGGFTQYANPTSVYLLAFVFWIFGPSILLARLLAAASMFTACLLLGTLAERVSGRRTIGFIVGLTALLTPWLFEIGRLMLETFFYPMAIVLFLWAVYRAHKRSKWTWSDCLLVALTLALLTYTYTIGRLLALLLALGLICFATNKQRIFAIAKTWVIYGLTLLPLIIYNMQNPGLTTRFYLITYIKPQSTLGEIIVKFISRYLEDLNPMTMLFKGDVNQRHHLPDALGSFFFATFILAIIGIVVVLVRHRRDAWWRFALFGLAASAVPGALTVDKFHTLRMIAYPVFLLLLTVPALKWLLDKSETMQTDDNEIVSDEPPNEEMSQLDDDDIVHDEPPDESEITQSEDIETVGDEPPDEELMESDEDDIVHDESLLNEEIAQPDNDIVHDEPPKTEISPSGQASWQLRRMILAVLLAVTIAEASYFYWQFHHEGYKRGYIFDSAYKQLYDAAVAQPKRPIYLVDNFWGPAYMHSFWYATLEGRSTAEFIHQPYGVRPPAGAIVLSTEQNCTDCTNLTRSGDYILYETTK